jgi:hypothetical protein
MRWLWRGRVNRGAGSRDFKNKDLIKPKMSGPYHETVCTLLQFFSSTAR